MHILEVHSNESACRKSGRLGLEQVSGVNSTIVVSRPSDVRSKVQEHHENRNLTSFCVMLFFFCSFAFLRWYHNSNIQGLSNIEVYIYHTYLYAKNIMYAELFPDQMVFSCQSFLRARFQICLVTLFILYDISQTIIMFIIIVNAIKRTSSTMPLVYVKIKKKITKKEVTS